MAFVKFKAPALPVPSVEYDQRYATDLIRALRLYFNIIDSLTPQQAESYKADYFYGGEFDGTAIHGTTVTADLFQGGDAALDYVDAFAVGAYAVRAGGLMAQTAVIKDIMANNFYGGMFYGDGRYINTPYNQFQSQQDQTGAVATATAVTFDTDDFPDSIYVASNSRITFGESGIYKLDYSLAFENTLNNTESVDVWFRYKGVDIPNSNSQFSIPARKSAGVYSYLIAVTPYMIDITAAGDWVEIMWRPSDAGVTLQQIPAVAANPGVTPAIPATPSVLLSVQFVSAQYPPVTCVAPAPVFCLGQVGRVSVVATP